MCGIAGILDPGLRRSGDDRREAVRRMCAALRHRGPDDEGFWSDDAAGVTLGHRRLSILDLSLQGHQPMLSHSRRLAMVFNGEIYNFAELRTEIERAGAVAWRGHSDSEIVLEAIERWGFAAALQRFNGMFAIAVWDCSRRTLTIARDRLGKKPLYYGWRGERLYLASELDAVRVAVPGSPDINRDALAALLRLNYIPAPMSIFAGIAKLPAACLASFDRDALERRRMPVPVPYWSPADAILRGQREPIRDEHEAMERLDGLLTDAVRLRMVADVPLGAFLSGGIDSSVVVACMQALSPRPVKTYAIGFDAAGDEAVHARNVARHLGTDHTELYVSNASVIEQIRDLPALTDEPHGDTAILPTYLVAKLARGSVTVSLSGDGGDELFGGYPRYLWMQELWLSAHRRGAFLPDPIRRAAGRGLARLPAGWRLQDLGRSWSMATPEEVWFTFVEHCHEPGDYVLGTGGTWRAPLAPSLPSTVEPLQRMVHLDLASRLPDSIVSKVDRTTMKVSLEARAPLMDYRLVEFSARIPAASKIRDGRGKWVLRELLYQKIPRGLVDRPKQGFKMPISEWLRGPLRPWAEDLLARDRLAREGYFRVEAVRNLWERHKAARGTHHYQLWDILSFQAWLASRGAV